MTEHETSDASRPGLDEIRLPDRVDTGARYELKGEIARGGMGAILEVFDRGLRRQIAMKVVLDGGGESSGDTRSVDPRMLARFLEEAQVTGQLDHPGVVPVHELGIDSDGRAYFTMRLVKGRELTEVIDEVHAGSDEWTMSRAAGVLLQVCETMAFAHDKGVLHRDLKPANVMVGRFGEVYVMDWGLARVGDQKEHDASELPTPSRSGVASGRADARESGRDSALATMDGTAIGTPYYMPPEQAAGRLGEVDERSDIYAVGAMLYHLLAGHVPYGVPDHVNDEPLMPHEVLRAVLERAPDPLPPGETALERRLREVCMKAMHRERDQRHASMTCLATELRSALFRSSYRPSKTIRSGLVVVNLLLTFVRWASMLLTVFFIVVILFAGENMNVSTTVELEVDSLEQSTSGAAGLEGSFGKKVDGTLFVTGAWAKPLMLTWLATSFLFVYALFQLGAFVKSLTINQPFDPRNVTRLRRLGFVVLLIGLMMFAIDYAVGAALATSEFEGMKLSRDSSDLLRADTWLGPLTVFMVASLMFAIAEAFRLGSSLQEEGSR